MRTARKTNESQSAAKPAPVLPRRDQEAVERRYDAKRMSWQSRVYLTTVIGSATLLAIVLFPSSEVFAAHAWSFSSLALCAAVAQFFVVRKPGLQALKPSIVFVVAATLLLPLQLLPLLTLIQYLPDAVKARPELKVGSFNIANGILDAIAAGAVFTTLAHLDAAPGSAGLHYAVAGIVACVVYVGVNHLLLAEIISLTSKSPLRATGLFDPEHLLIDFTIGGLGVGVATLALHNLWTTPLLVLPLVLIRRALTVPQLQAEARADAKTGLYNAGHFNRIFAEELARAKRFERPFALLMADLDLLREINNTHGHLAGDAVLQGIADVFREELRHFDVAGRFGGEEFSILLPETSPEQAFEIADRIRARIDERRFETRTVPMPIHATISIGISSFPQDGHDEKSLVHQADIAVYRAKQAGRNRVVAADPEQQVVPVPTPTQPNAGQAVMPLLAIAPSPEPAPDLELEVEAADQHDDLGFRTLPRVLRLTVAAVCLVGLAAGAAGLVFAHDSFRPGLLALAALVAGGQALSFELAEFEGAISVSAVGSLAGAAMFDYRAALPLALAAAIVDWSARRTALHHFLFNVATLSLASLGAAAAFSLADLFPAHERLATAGVGFAAGGIYFGVNMSLVSIASALARQESPRRVFQERFAWLLQHYVVYGFIGGVMAVAYDAAGLYALCVFAVPLLLMRRTQEAYLRHTQRSTQKLREAADTIRAQNVSLEQANRLLRERSNAAMESLSATVDARDSYTAGHSRRVQQLALAIGRELGLSESDLALLDRAALFHDIGKLAVPDAILLRPGSLDPDEWGLMQRHAEEGARIIERLGFLHESVPSIRHHHEHWDGSGYPAGLAGEEIPLGARIIHVADALDSMLTTRIYRAARPLADALGEIRRASGTQFCPVCVDALERLLPLNEELVELPRMRAIA
jgi:diguanylate cyclase (GGDEF)-like protein/putative nucleotidyltransferase with HDIG domain